MSLQKKAFLDGEADNWCLRNDQKPGEVNLEKDPVYRVLSEYSVKNYSTVAEVGCGIGHRLSGIAELCEADGKGVDPSGEAIGRCQAYYPKLDVEVGVANALPWGDGSIDVLIYGFCLYLVDRTDLFTIAAEGDRVLSDGGILVVYDFHPLTPYANDYVHQEGLKSYKMDHSRMWGWSDRYSLAGLQLFDHSNMFEKAIRVDENERLSVVILQKEGQASGFRDE